MGGGFSIQQIPDLTGKVAVVTGGNSGIGYYTALTLAQKNARVFIACRDSEKTHNAVKEMNAQLGEGAVGKVEWLELRLDSLRSVKKFCDEFRALNLPLHILINNAGVMFNPYRLSEDGIESHFALNVGHHLLTTSLLDIIEKSAPSRIVNLSSTAQQYARKFPLEKINDKDGYDAADRYFLVKCCNILFSLELTKRIGTDKQVYVNSVHPGVVDTDLFRSFRESYGSIFHQTIKFASRAFFISPRHGARTSLYCATSPEIEEKNIRGRYFVPYGKLRTPIPLARDENYAKEVWEFTEDLIKKKLEEKTETTAAEAEVSAQ